MPIYIYAVRPLLIVAGDRGQMKPIETNLHNRIIQVQSVLQSPHLQAFKTFNLVVQHRCHDQFLTTFLDHIRVEAPTRQMLCNINSKCFFFTHV